MHDPIALFEEWLDRAEEGNRLSRPRAFCLSTVDADGSPEGRFVDLKEVTREGFVFSSSLVSGKARAIAEHARVGMTFWWEHVERQVRVAGMATRVSDVDADGLFSGRPRDAQLASWASHTSAEMQKMAELEDRLKEVRQRFANGPVPRPNEWGGYRVVPHRVEFLRFQENRLHHRTLYTKEGTHWRSVLLQP